MRNILVVGTGTIGEPLVGLFSRLKDKFGIKVYFHKRTPLLDEVAKVNSLVDHGASLVVDAEKVKQFQILGHEPVLNYEAALNLCDVIVDCTPAGNLAKKEHYLPLAKEKKKKVFIAQGSEKDFGLPYAYGINDEALIKSTPNFIQVVSCNTHNICSVLKSLSPEFESIVTADFVCVRRANDISQDGGFIASPEVGPHKDYNFGTHHAADAARVLNTMNKRVLMYSSAMKINSQYMHIIRFSIVVKGHMDKNNAISRFRENPFVALTHKNLANKVFSFGRDHGYYGRIFNQTVVSIPTIHTVNFGGTTKVSGFCFTPQDGNSLISSIAATLYGLYGRKYKNYTHELDSLLFDEV